MGVGRCPGVPCNPLHLSWAGDSQALRNGSSAPDGRLGHSQVMVNCPLFSTFLQITSTGSHSPCTLKTGMGARPAPPELWPTTEPTARPVHPPPPAWALLT